MKTAPVYRDADGATPAVARPPDAARHGAQAEDRFASNGKRKIRLLVFTSLYPNAEQPRHGMFVEARLRRLVDSGLIAATVVAPVPWFPFRHQRFGTYATFARVPRREERHGIQILHPRYPVVPKLSMTVAPSLMYHTLLPALQKLKATGTDFDLIDAHYFYPDGVAAARLGRALSRPVVITARGTDVNLIPRYCLPRWQIKCAAKRSAAIVTVSSALKDRLADLGINPGKVTVLRNGVDLDRFHPRDREAIRNQFGLTGTVWLTVGNLVETKGVHITLAALAQTADVTLLVAGEGPEDAHLRQLAVRLGIDTRVRFLGAVPHVELTKYYNAADVMLLASISEGMPNVVLESLACGTPVIVAPFESARELVNAPEAGEVAAQRSPEAIVSAWLSLRSRLPMRAATRGVSEGLGWQPVVEAQYALYAQVVATDTCSGVRT